MFHLSAQEARRRQSQFLLHFSHFAFPIIFQQDHAADDISLADDRGDQLPGIVHGNVFRNVDIVAVSFAAITVSLLLTFSSS